jgi:hypothetical protein
MVNISSNINKPKESLNSEGQQFLQYQQTITAKTFIWFVDIGGIVDHHCSNFLLVC